MISSATKHGRKASRLFGSCSRKFPTRLLIAWSFAFLGREYSALSPLPRC